MTFEELGSILDGMEINLEQVAPFQIDKEAYLSSHGYGSTGGVTKAVVEHLGGPEVNALLLSNLNKKNIGLLRAYAKSGKCPNQFIEVMACENGCISGPVTRIDKATAAKVYTKELARMATERKK
jgi:iron only hydrogenase large subunit-like protein